jgi:AMMECR1 domain-containing protein
MIEIVEQVIKYFAAHGKAPEIGDLEGVNNELLERQGSVFVTLYSAGEVRGSA